MTNNIVIASDQRINRMDFQESLGESIHADVWAIVPAQFASPWWPASSGMLGDTVADYGVLAAAEGWSDFDQQAGASSRYLFAGVTRDVYGTAVGGATVVLFRSSDNALIDSSISDAGGNFTLNTGDLSAHYIVAHKTGSPDVDGVTPNTLVGV